MNFNYPGSVIVKVVSEYYELKIVLNYDREGFVHIFASLENVKRTHFSTDK